MPLSHAMKWPSHSPHTSHACTGSGAVGKAELRLALREMGVDATPSTVAGMIKAADLDGNGDVSLDEFQVTAVCMLSRGQRGVHAGVTWMPHPSTVPGVISPHSAWCHAATPPGTTPVHCPQCLAS